MSMSGVTRTRLTMAFEVPSLAGSSARLRSTTATVLSQRPLTRRWHSLGIGDPGARARQIGRRSLVRGKPRTKMKMQAAPDAQRRGLTLAGFEPLVRLVDDVDAALAAHDA